MVVKLKRNKILNGLIGSLTVGFVLSSNIGCDSKGDYVDRGVVVESVESDDSEKSEVEKYRIEREKILDNLERVSGGRLLDRDAVFNSKLENKDLETFVEIYENDRKYREDENWGEDYIDFNPNTDIGIEKLTEYEKTTPGLNLIPEGYLTAPKNYLWKDKDKTAIAQYMIMNGDVDFGTITF